MSTSLAADDETVIRHNVGIYKHQLFKISETFIHAQVSKLLRHYPIYLGKDILGPMPDDFEVYHPLGKGISWRKLRYLLLKDTSVFESEVLNREIRLLHAYFGMDAVYAEKVARRLKLPLVITFLGFDVTSTKRFFLSSLKPSLVRYAIEGGRLIDRSSLNLCYSNFLRDHLIERGFSDQNTFTHYVGVDTQRSKRILESAEKKSRKTIVHVARLVEKKGTKYLIKAFAKIADHHKDAQMIIIGEGPLRSELMELVATLRLQDSVKFTGAIHNDEVLAHVVGSHIFALPSVTSKSGDSEGLPFSILEAMSLRMPIIGTFHSGIPEAVQHEKNGLLSNEKDVDALASHLDYLLESDSMREDMAGASQSIG